MEGTGSQLHSRILDWLRFPAEHKGIHLYQIGCTASTLNVHAQQKRAFNLLWALRMDGFQFDDAEVAVIGGGISGLTVAAGFLVAGVQKVTIYERTNHLIHLQQGNSTRCLHPNFAIWPHAHFRYPVTHLPFMNWRAGAAGEVADQLLWQWSVLRDLYGDRIEIEFGCSVRRVDFREGEPFISIKTDRPGKGGKYRLVVLAVGYGIEANTFAETPSYWRNDELSQPMVGSGSKTKFLVSGTGDGGLIEVLRLRLDKFQHQAFLQDIMYDENLLRLGRQLQRALSGTLRPIRVWQSFLREPLSTEERSVLRKFAEFYRDDTEVILNARKPYPSQTDALLLHRLCVALLIKDEKVTYVNGKLPAKIDYDKKRQKFASNVATGCFTHKRVVSDRVIRRQNAVPDFDKLFKVGKYDKRYFEALRKKWRAQDRSAEGDVTVKHDHLEGFLSDEFMRCHFESEYEVAFRCDPSDGFAEALARQLVGRLPKEFLEDAGQPTAFQAPLDLKDSRKRFVSLSLRKRFLITFRGLRVPGETWGLRSPIVTDPNFLIVQTNSRELLESLLVDSDEVKYHIFGIYLTVLPTAYLPPGLEFDQDVVDCGSRVFIVNRQKKGVLEIHCDEGMSQAHSLLRAPTLFELLLNKWPTTKVHGMGWAVRNTRNTNQTDARGSQILQWDPPGYPLRLNRKDNRG